MKIDERLTALEKKLLRIEAVVWYVGASLLIKQGIDILPLVQAMLN